MDNATAPASSPTKSHQRPAYSGSSGAAPEAVWTASRCNRLLRPIGSRINLLRKHRKNGSFPVGLGLVNQTEEHTVPHCPSQGSRICTVNRSSLGLERRSHRNDPDWVPGSELRKKVKHKYSGRGIEDGRQLAGGSRGIKASAQSRQPSPNDSTVPTPYLSRNREGGSDEYPKSHGEARPSTKIEPPFASGCERRRPRVPCLGNPSTQLPAALLQRLRRLTEHSSWALIEGIVIGFDMLLKATAAPPSGGQNGARSLFSLCLRRVPEYISEEQEWQQEESENDQLDVSSEVYADLEEFGSSQGHGWVHLSEVVRAHGVALLSDAIREGLLTQDAARALVRLCIHHSALGEAELLVSALVSAQIPHRKPRMEHCKISDHQISTGLSTLNLFAQQTGRHGFHYRQIDSLLVTGILPVARLASRDLITLWGNAIKSISQVDDNSTDAVRLLYTAITLACDCSLPVQEDIIHRIRLYSMNNRRKHGDRTERATSRRYRLTNRLANHGGREPTTRTCTDSGVDADLSKLVSRLLTILSATALSQAKNPEKTSNEAGDIGAIAGLAMIVRGISESKHTEDPACAHSEDRTALVFMAESLLPLALQSSAERSLKHTSAVSCPSMIAKLGLPQHVTTVSGRLDDLASYVNAVACCAGRISQDNGFSHTQILSDYLVGLLTPTTASAQISSLERQAFAYIGLQSASLFAKENPSVTHFEYAEKIAQLAHSQGLNEGSLSRQGCGLYSRRFRWEEGIEEWVAITPASNHKKRKICTSGSTVSTESEDEDDGTESLDPISDDTDITDPENVSDLDELDKLPIAVTGVRASLGTLSQNARRNECRATRAQTGLISIGVSRKKRIVPTRLIDKAHGKSEVIRWVGEVESEDELSFS